MAQVYVEIKSISSYTDDTHCNISVKINPVTWDGTTPELFYCDLIADPYGNEIITSKDLIDQAYSDNPTCTFEDLTPGTTYYIMVAVTGKITEYSSSNYATKLKEIKTYFRPATLAASTILEVTDTSITASSTVTNLNGGTLENHTLRLAEVLDDGTWGTMYQTTSKELVITRTFNNLKPNTNYIVINFADNEYTVESKYFEQSVTTKTAPPTVSNPEILEVTNTSITIKSKISSLNGNELIMHDLYIRKPAEPGSPLAGIIDAYPGQGLEFTGTFADLEHNTAYPVWAEAYNEVGLGTSEEIVVTTLGNPPVISNLQAIDITSSSCVLTWDTTWDTNASRNFFTIRYGTTTDYGTEATGTTLTGLQPETKYYVEVIETDNFNNATTATLEFTTLPIQPPVVTVTSVDVTPYTATINFSEQFDGGATRQSYMIDYGETTDYGLVSENSNLLTALKQTTTYYYRISVTDDGGRIGTYSGEFTTDTVVPPTLDPPIISNIQIDRFTASIKGTIHNNGTITEKYIYAYKDAALTQIQQRRKLTGTATAMTPIRLYHNYTYYVYATAKNEAGLGTSPVVQVTTLGNPPSITKLKAKPIRNTCILTWETTWEVRAERDHFIIEYGTTTDYGITSTEATLTDLQRDTKYYAKITETDNWGRSGTATIEFTTGNYEPIVTLIEADMTEYPDAIIDFTYELYEDATSATYTIDYTLGNWQNSTPPYDKTVENTNRLTGLSQGTYGYGEYYMYRINVTDNLGRIGTYEGRFHTMDLRYRMMKQSGSGPKSMHFVLVSRIYHHYIDPDYFYACRYDEQEIQEKTGTMFIWYKGKIVYKINIAPTYNKPYRGKFRTNPVKETSIGNPYWSQWYYEGLSAIYAIDNDQTEMELTFTFDSPNPDIANTVFKSNILLDPVLPPTLKDFLIKELTRSSVKLSVICVTNDDYQIYVYFELYSDASLTNLIFSAKVRTTYSDQSTVTNLFTELTPNTIYYARVYTQNTRYTSYSDTLQVITLGNNPIINTSKVIITGHKAEIIFDYSLEINATLLDYTIAYGETTEYSMVLVNENVITNLKPDTTYYYQISVTDNWNRVGTYAGEFTTPKFATGYIKEFVLNEGVVWKIGMLYVKVNGEWKKGIGIYNKKEGTWNGRYS